MRVMKALLLLMMCVALVVAAIRNAVIGVLVEHLPQSDGRREALATRARELAHVFARVVEKPSEMPTRMEET